MEQPPDILEKSSTISNKFILLLEVEVQKGELIEVQLTYDTKTGMLKESSQLQLNLSYPLLAIDKPEFFVIARSIPFLCDLLRAETFWQDRKTQKTLAKSAQGFIDLKTSFSFNVPEVSKHSSSFILKTPLPVMAKIFFSDDNMTYLFEFSSAYKKKKVIQGIGLTTI
jgi:hypothetical protein